MKKLFGCALLALFPAMASAATFPPCDFGKFAGQVMPVPSSIYQKYFIPMPSANTSVTQAVPYKTGHVTWDCSTGTANWQQCLRSANTNACGTAAPTTATGSTDWETNPVCRKLDMISGTTINDAPTLKGVSSVTAGAIAAGSYCYQ